MPPGDADLRRKAVLVGTSLLGLLLAVAGLTPAATGVENLPARFALDLPAWLGVVFLFVTALIGLSVFILFLTGVGRQVRKRETQGWRTIAPLFTLLVLLLLWIALRDQEAIAFFHTLRTLLGIGFAPPVPVAPEIEPPPVHSPLLSGIAQALLLALALVVMAALGWVYLAFMPRRGRGLAPPLEHAALQAAVHDSLDDLRSLPDARLAILRCYERFERLLAGAAVGRAPWQTALEFMRAALRHPWLPREGVRELTSLFELARFSQHALGPDERERAWQALMAVKAALENESHRAPTN